MKTGHRQQGFTLIELIVVIVILGILSAIALPKFVDLSSEAGVAAVKGVAGAISSAASINVANKKLKGSGVDISDAVDACAGAASSVKAGAGSLLSATTNITLVTTTPATDNEYKIAGASSICSAGERVSCTLTNKSGASAVATVACTN